MSRLSYLFGSLDTSHASRKNCAPGLVAFLAHFHVYFVAMAVLFGALIVTDSHAGTFGPYQTSVVSVYDGDTFTADVSVWPGQTIRTSVRVIGIDAPEVRGSSDCEKSLAAQSRDYLKLLLSSGQVTISSIKLDAYRGRVDAEVFVDGKPIADAMIISGNARAYDGKAARLPWCQ